ncbi:MAG: inositol monophosphatase [Verrucomicrobia bacterium]|nr:inositol monophosphatase [Verrucomicrobiota bacterium]
MVGDPASEHRWVVDPIDGTVNFTYGIPHACVSIALQGRRPKPRSSRREEALTPICNLQSALRNRREPPHVGCSSRERGSKSQPASDADYETLVGVVFDPFCDELFTAVRGQAAKVNGRQVRVSSRRRLDEAIISVGFAKTRASLNQMLPGFKRLVHRVRKIRIMGAAALSLAYVAAGRMDAYVESGLRLWDIAAGGLLIECAGGDFFHEPVAGGRHTYRILANNGLLRKPLAKLV